MVSLPLVVIICSKPVHLRLPARKPCILHFQGQKFAPSETYRKACPMPPPPLHPIHRWSNHTPNPIRAEIAGAHRPYHLSGDQFFITVQHLKANAQGLADRLARHPSASQLGSTVSVNPYRSSLSVSTRFPSFHTFIFFRGGKNLDKDHSAPVCPPPLTSRPPWK